MNLSGKSGTKVLRDGSRLITGYGDDQAEVYLRNHTRTAHAGQVKQDCAACNELQKRIERWRVRK